MGSLISSKVKRMKSLRTFGIEAAQEAKKKTPEESATFASKFKNAAEDTATDIDTVTDNFQSDMKNIQSAMESVTNGTFQNSDMADLIQQFPELSNASGDLKDNLQNLAMDKGVEAIGKIRDSVKDVTDPKQLAQADKYVQSIKMFYFPNTSHIIFTPRQKPFLKFCSNSAARRLRFSSMT